MAANLRRTMSLALPMKRLGLTLALSPAMLFVLTVLRGADTKTTGGVAPADTSVPPAPATSSTTATAKIERAPENPAPPRAMTAEEILKRFDKNGDGKLDEDERADAHDTMMKTQRERQAARLGNPNAEQFQKRMLELFDKNHDGRLDEEERAEARKYAEEHGFGGGGTMREEMLKRFDKNGDGKLDEDERAEMQKAMRARGPNGPGAMMRQEILRRFDKNADGKIDDTEWTELDPMLRQRLENAPMQRQRYDSNGDGKIDDEEWAKAAPVIRQWLNEPAPAAAAESAKPKRDAK